MHASASKEHELWGEAKLESINSSLPINANLPESAYLDLEEYAHLSLQKIMDKLDNTQDSINAKMLTKQFLLGRGMGLDFLREVTQMNLKRLKLKNYLPSTGTPGISFDVRMVSDVLTLATFGAVVSCDVRNC